jgi:hypothetical protein
LIWFCNQFDQNQENILPGCFFLSWVDRTSRLSQFFDQADLFGSGLDCASICLDGDIDHALNILFWDLVSAEPVDDVLYVIKARPETRSLLAGLNEEGRRRDFLADGITNAD